MSPFGSSRGRGRGDVLHGLQRRRDPSSIEGCLVKSRWYGGRFECASLTMAGEIDVDDCEVDKDQASGLTNARRFEGETDPSRSSSQGLA